MNFFVELKRRRVIRVAIVYAVTAWLLVQIAVAVEAPLNLPQWVDTLVIVLLGLGFPVAMVIAWAFEITPQGVQPTSRINDKTAKPQVLHNSIAVLPFENLSPNPDDAYFAAGMHEEVLNQLSKIKDLAVIARTTTMRYGQSEKTVPEIAAELNVGTVMEGSVRYAGERVRITSQLIDAETGVHLWSKAYERDLRDVFAIQSDIALEITDAMKAEFSVEERQAIATALTDNPDAYAHYVRAMSRLSRPAPDLHTIQGDLDKAMELDPDFAAVLALKAYFHTAAVSLVTQDVTLETQTKSFAQAAAYADRALAIDPNQARAYTARAFVEANHRHWASAFENSERAYELNPNQPQVIFDYASRLSLQRGKVDEGLAMMDRAIELDPQNVSLPMSAAFAMIHESRFDDVTRYSSQVIAMAPDFYLPYVQLAIAAAFSGDRNLAVEMAQEAEARLGKGAPASSLIMLLNVYDRLNQTEATARTLSKLYEIGKVKPLNDFQLARTSASSGDLDKAFEHLNAMIDNNFPSFPIQFLVFRPDHSMWEGLQDDPRFEEARKKVTPPG